MEAPTRRPLMYFEKVVADVEEKASDLDEILYRESYMRIMKSGTWILFLAQIFFQFIIIWK